MLFIITLSHNIQFDELMNDVCGVVGLWFGFAVMTFLEYVEMSVDIIIIVFRGMFKKNQ